MDWSRYVWSAVAVLALPILMLLSKWGIDRAKGYKASLRRLWGVVPFVAALVVLEIAQRSGLVASRWAVTLFVITFWVCYSITYAALGTKRA